MDKLLASIKRLCAPHARIIFGVPIESGPSGFAKAIYRVMKGGRQDATIGGAFKSLFGLDINRIVSDVEWYGSHTGFSYKSFMRDLSRHGFEVVSTRCLPFPATSTFLNNEIYFVCRATIP
jgi:hypothetical protein